MEPKVYVNDSLFIKIKKIHKSISQKISQKLKKYRKIDQNLPDFVIVRGNLLIYQLHLLFVLLKVKSSLRSKLRQLEDL